MENLQKIAVMMDAERIQACKTSDILREIAACGRIVVKRAYGDWRKESLKAWENEINRLAIKTEQQFDAPSGKDAANTALVMDTMELLCSGMYDAFAIVSGGSGYTPLAVRLREAGVYVIGAGDQEAPESFQNACDLFLHISAAPAQPPVCPPEEDARDEEGTQEEEDTQDGAGTPDEDAAAVVDRVSGMARIHELLQAAHKRFQKENGYTDIDTAYHYIKAEAPDLNPRDYGFRYIKAGWLNHDLQDYGSKDLYRLIRAFPNRYQTIQPAPGVLAFRCISSGKGYGTPEELDCIHYLLQVAWRVCRQEDGCALISKAGQLIKSIKPDINFREHGFSRLSDLIRACPDRYAVIADHTGASSFQCIGPEEEDVREESLTQKDKQARKGIRNRVYVPAQSMSRLFYLLQIVWKAYQREDGYAAGAYAVYFLKYAKPDFDPGYYGFESLSQLIQAYPDRYEMVSTEDGGFLYKYRRASRQEPGAPAQPPACPPEEDAPEEEGARDGMDTPPEDAGTAAEENVAPEEEDRAEDVQPQEREQLQEQGTPQTQEEPQEQAEFQTESGGADDMDRIHHLLRLIWRSFRRKAGYVTVTLAGSLIRDAKPDFSYGFEELSRLIQACPDRYEVSRNDAGKLIYKCIIQEEEDEKEEALTQEDIQAREKSRDENGNDTAGSLNRIHHLLKRACDAYQREDGYVSLAYAVYFFKYVKPDFDPGDYGFETLSQLILAFPARYEVSRSDAGGFLYKCIDFEEVSRAEEAESGAADGMDRIHHLLRRACDLYRQADGYTFMTDAGQFVKKVKPAFDPHTYGFGTLLQLVQSYSDRYEVIKNAAGTLLYQCITPEAVQMQEAPQEIACVGTEE